ncbi:Transcription-silencing protein Clr2 [Penicillium bovifimosum]|uniref:Transcription-silencing protein Clr2 n=1 Tax=Penicillium bovifimosum TaxID=126998 RepID=A0A9W9GNN2_9EURO|nr:Transcription-silencing protein Clr2 [Penicillium bovifimosum]KAJ5124804.1 Transcription-silencing protein Clr2 [Penicillium bovifimosum]
MKEMGSASEPVARTAVPPPSDNTRQPADAEVPDFWRPYVVKLLENGQIDEYAEEPVSFDSILAHKWITRYDVKPSIDPAYVPRCGELVLWIWDGLEDGSLTLNPVTGRHEILGNDHLWHGLPCWRAGVVTEMPLKDTYMRDITETPDDPHGLIYSWFRVEALPHPLGDDKTYSKQYNYVPLRNIRPFNAWKIFLKDQNWDKSHPSILNAMNVISSWSVVRKYHIVGKDRNCSIHCKAIFIGSELLAVSDTIRLKPEGFEYPDLEEGPVPKITDVMVITNILFQLIDCVDNDPLLLAEHRGVLISGRVYTTDPSRVRKSYSCLFHDPTADENPRPLTPNEVFTAFRQPSMYHYGPWYKMANGEECNVALDAVIGRYYEAPAAYLMFGTHSLEYDLLGVTGGRKWSSQDDVRIPDGMTWFQGKCRAETLGVTELLGVECGPSAPQGDENGQTIVSTARESLHRQDQIHASETPATATLA